MEIIDANKVKAIKERMATVIKKCVDENQILDDWLIAEAVFDEFKGEFEMLESLL